MSFYIYFYNYFYVSDVFYFILFEFMIKYLFFK